MHYGPRTGSGMAPGVASDVSDMAADARKALAGIQAELPPDCATALMDICGYEKGLQAVEIERGWPRRSAKIVLRIALEQLAHRLGLTEMASGPETGRPREWLPPSARPTEFR